MINKSFNQIAEIHIQELEKVVFVKIQPAIQVQSIQDLTKISGFNIQKCLQHILESCILKERRLIMCILFEDFPQLYGAMLTNGIAYLIKQFSMKNIYTNVDVIGIQYEKETHKEVISVLIQNLKKIEISAVLHGTIFQLKKPKTINNDQNKPFILVTGGNRGIGREASQQLAKIGLNIIITARSISEQMVEFANYLSKKYNVTVRTETLNLKQKQSRALLAKNLLKDQIRLSGVVHNGGVGSKTCISQTGLLQSPQETLIQVNSIGTIDLHNQLRNEGVLKENCVITVISSISACRFFAEMNPIDGISKAILQSWINQMISQNYNVVTIYPGATDTEMFQQSTTNKLKSEGKLNQFVSKLPKQMLINPNIIGIIIAMTQNPKLAPYLNKNKLIAACGMDIDYRPLIN